MIGNHRMLHRIILFFLIGALSGIASAISVTITDPAIAEDQSAATPLRAVSVSGTVAGANSVESVLWKSSRGFSDLAKVHSRKDAAGNIFFTTSLIPLRAGVNHIEFIVTDGRGQAARTAVNFLSTAHAKDTPADESAWQPRTSLIGGRPMSYQLRDSLAIYEGDIVLGSDASLAAADATAKRQPASTSVRPDAVVIAYRGGVWPIVGGVGRVPYTISARDQGVAGALANINQAVSEFNAQLAGVIQFVPATGGDVNYAEFDMDPANLNGVCESFVGYQANGPQLISGSIACTVPTLMHEMGHSIGLWHEQSRSDRNTYVKFNEAAIDKPQLPNFTQLTDNAVNSGLYNYASIMHYPPFEFSRDGVSVTLESIPAGIPLSTPLPQYTSGDIDAITRLYGGAPKYVVIDTNPSGLSVVVDGQTYSTPQSFEWSIGSIHNLDIPAGVQTLSGSPYIFGRWNLATLTATQTVTVTAGSGALLSPSKSPAVTNYLANFIPIHVYSATVNPAAAGTVSVTPAPSTTLINGVSTPYFADRQQIKLTATPAPGHTFYDWYGAGLFNYYSGAYTFNVTGDLSTLGAQFVTGPVTTVNAASPDVGALGSFPGFFAVVDGTSYVALPKNWNTAFDGTAWAAGTAHTLCATALVSGACPTTALPSQSPVTTNISYAFSNWSGSAGSVATNALAFNVTGHQTFTENHIPSFRWIVLPSPFTSGCDSVSPSANNQYLDQFFTRGAPVSLSAIPSSGSAFVGWSQDLAGTANPDPLSVVNQLYATANFNVSGATAPLQITSFTPASAVATPAATTLTINGTGFVNNGSVFVYYNGNFRASTYVSPTRYQVQLQAGDLATAGYDTIAVLNYEPSGCGPYVQTDFAVRARPGRALLKIAKTHTGNFKRGQLGASYTISVPNTGGAATTGAVVTVTDMVPVGMTLVSMAGSGWTCTSGGNSCTRSDVLNAGFSYPAITVTVDVAANAGSPLVNQASVSGGGAATMTVKNSTIVSP